MRLRAARHFKRFLVHGIGQILAADEQDGSADSLGIDPRKAAGKLSAKSAVDNQEGKKRTRATNKHGVRREDADQALGPELILLYRPHLPIAMFHQAAFGLN